MPYLQPALKPGYNVYLSADGDPGIGMDVGLLLLEPGESWSGGEADREQAFLLLEGELELRWAGQSARIRRAGPFLEEASCLHLSPGTPFSLRALSRSEVYIQGVKNPEPFESRLYLPADVAVQRAGSAGELLGAMRRDIKTLFDYESAPWSNMVLGEVLNYPGRWSSYPPHWHPRPEVYFHRFDRPQGFGASFANGEVYVSRHNGLTVIEHGFHAQAAAPGYAMCYVWGIRHLKDEPWRKTRIDEPEHAWLWREDANGQILHPEEKE